MQRRDVASFVIYNNKSEILLQKKSLDYRYDSNGYWGLFGGGIKEGEGPILVAGEREIREELGDLLVENLINVTFWKSFEYVFQDMFYGEEHLFEGKYEGPLSNIRLGEGAGFAFFAYSELGSIKLPDRTRKILEEYFREKGL